MLAGVRQSIRFAAPVLAVAVMVATVPVARVAAAPKPPAPATSVAIPVVGTASDGGTFSGVFNLTSFAVQQGAVVANGTVSGIMTSAAGTPTSVLANVTAPVAAAPAACDILNLNLGPLSLNLLGLQV